MTLFMKKPLLFLLALIMIQCNRNPENKNPEVLSNEIELSREDNAVEIDENPMSYLGMYKGLMPGIGSDKTPVVIELSETFSFTISSDTIPKEKKIIQKGTFKWTPNGKSIMLTANSGIEKEFNVLENKLSLKLNAGSAIFEKMKSSEVINLESETTKATITTFIDEKWMITSINDKPINSKGIKKDYYVIFNKNKKFNAFAGCNQIGGNYSIKGDQIKMSNILSNAMACAEMEMEQLLLKALAEADNIIQNNQYMYLRKKGEVLIKFEAAENTK